MEVAERDKLDIVVMRLDVRYQYEIDDAVAHAERLAGGAIDVLINNAGISYGGPVEIQDLEATRHTFETNVYDPGCSTRNA